MKVATMKLTRYSSWPRRAARSSDHATRSALIGDSPALNHDAVQRALPHGPRPENQQHNPQRLDAECSERIRTVHAPYVDSHRRVGRGLERQDIGNDLNRSWKQRYRDEGARE